MRKGTAPRRRTFSFEGAKVSVVASILKKWDAIPTEEKYRLYYHSLDGMITRLRTESENQVENAWRRELDLLGSLLKIDLLSSIKGLASEKDPKKLLDAARTLEKAAKQLRKRALALVQTPSISRANDLNDLRRILLDNWVPRDNSVVDSFVPLQGVCLCWMSYSALAKFLRLTCPNLPVPATAALKKECQRLGLSKMDHPFVEEEHICQEQRGVLLLAR